VALAPLAVLVGRRISPVIPESALGGGRSATAKNKKAASLKAAFQPSAQNVIRSESSPTAYCIRINGAFFSIFVDCSLPVFFAGFTVFMLSPEGYSKIFRRNHSYFLDRLSLLAYRKESHLFRWPSLSSANIGSF
jgi:hypothetical protein